MIRTRIAPSPTGYPHIGTIYQALFDYAFAKKNAGKFILRIEDTDRERFVSDAEAKLYAALDWFGLVEDESPRKGGTYSPYRQSERLALYQQYAQELYINGFAYYCFCSKERLEEIRKKQQEQKRPIIMYDKHCRNLTQEEIAKKIASSDAKVVRLKVPIGEKIICLDEIRGNIIFDTTMIDDQVLLKADGFPTYHLAVVVDDHFMQITDVVRGEEWLPSFPKHVLLYRYFGWDLPKFFHTAALRNPDKSKLSKRQGHTNVTWYQEEGYLPNAILNYIALLGWSHPEEKEIFSLDEFIKHFDLQDIKPIGPIFDITKLQWMNGEYIRELQDEQLKEMLFEFYKNDTAVIAFIESDIFSIDFIIALAKTRMKTLGEFKDLVLPAMVVYSEHEKKIAKDVRHVLESITDWNKDTILAALRIILKKHEIKMNILYKLFTGKERGLPLPEYLQSITKSETIKRLPL